MLVWNFKHKKVGERKRKKEKEEKIKLRDSFRKDITNGHFCVKKIGKEKEEEEKESRKHFGESFIRSAKMQKQIFRQNLKVFSFSSLL